MDLSKIKLIEFFKPKNWMSVIRAFINSDVYQAHIIEQIMFRRIECKPCVDAGSCLHCGCSMSGKVPKWADLQAECSDGIGEYVKKGENKDKAEYKAAE